MHIYFIKFYDSPYSGSRGVPCGPTDGRTDRHDKTNRCFLQCCEKRLKIKIFHREENREQISAMCGKCKILLYKPGGRQTSPYPKTLCARSSGRPNFIRWCLIFVCPQYRNCFMSPFCA